jgi:hypothetical protein
MPYLPTDILGANPGTPGVPLSNDGTANTFGQQDSLSLLFTEHRIAQLGRYFISNNATIGTAVARAASGAGNNTFVSTTPLFTINNTGSATAGTPTNRSIFLRNIKLFLGGTAPTAAFELEVAVFVSQASRAPSAGNIAVTPVNIRGFSGTAPVAAIQAFNGAELVVPADANAKMVARGRISCGLPVLGDTYALTFGGSIDPTAGGGGSGATRTTASSPGNFVCSLEPVIIQPQEWGLVYVWMPSAATNPQSFEWALSHVEL